MLLTFDAKQKLRLSVKRKKEFLSKYLLEEERVVGAMLDPKKLLPEGEGRYKYTVTNIGESKLASFDKIWAAFSAYVPLGPKYATCLRMIKCKKKRNQISIGGI